MLFDTNKDFAKELNNDSKSRTSFSLKVQKFLYEDTKKSGEEIKMEISKSGKNNNNIFLDNKTQNRK